MTIREEIQDIITKAASPEKAAIDVCVYLDDQFDLQGNGWFDDDEAVLNALKGAA